MKDNNLIRGTEGGAAALFQTPDYQLPDARGHFGPYGGSFVAETLSHALAGLGLSQ